MSYIEFDLGNDIEFEKEKHLVSVLRCCEEWCDPEKKPEIRVRNYYSWHFIIGGCGKLHYESGGKTVETELSKGDSFLLYAGTEYDYKPDKERPWGYDWIDIAGENLDDLFWACGYSKEKPYLRIKNFDMVRTLISELIEMYDASDTQNMKCAARFMSLISYVIENNRKTMNRSGLSYAKKAQKLRGALIYINNNYRLDVDVGMVAHSTYVSADYLKHLFIELLGISVTEYVNRFRISSACAILLKDKTARVEEVADYVGYADPKYFARVFKRVKGISASEYKHFRPEEDPFKWLKERNIDFR